MKNIISGVQPTGNLHIGNYLGSIARWSGLQDKYNCFFPIVDLHAITAGLPEAQEFKNNIYLTLASYLASGIDSDKAIIFQQSHISAHAELFWILSNVVQIGKLNRMTQFKDKSGKHKEKAVLGLYAYPVLMAADIMLYDATLVPVGEDQLQHIELTNDIIASFNHKYNSEVFAKIEPLIMAETKRIMSLRDGTKKMSKSEISDMSRINLSDSDDLIKKKISKAKTDNIADFTTELDNRPEIRNLLGLFAAFSGEKMAVIQERYNHLGFQKFKHDLSDAIIAKINPISQKIYNYYADKSYLDTILKKGAKKAEEAADKKIHQVKQIMGMI